MMNPDLMQMMHQQRHQKLWAEAEQLRAQRELASSGASGSCGWLAAWLRRLSARRMRGITLIGRAG